MTQVTRAAYAASISARLPDNTAGEISEGDLRDLLTDLEDSVLWYDEGGGTVADGSITTAKLADDAVTSAKLEDTGITPGTYNFATVTFDAQGRATSASSGSPGGSGFSQEEIEDFVGGMVTGNTETLISVTYQTDDNTLDFAVEGNLSAYTNDAGFITSGANVFTGTQDFNGQQVEGALGKVVAGVSGALTAAEHSGNTLLTSGNVTIPTTAGFSCIIRAGGAHTVTFNGTTSAAMALGDLMTVIVESGTVIHAVLTPSANKVAFS